MAFAEALLSFLDNPEEPLEKRLKLADNAFISAEVPLQQREAFLFKWVLKYSSTHEENYEELFDLLLKWIQSDQFAELNRNDVGNSDVVYIVDILSEKLKLVDSNSSAKDQITNIALSLLKNKIFQEYFKHNLEKYCHILSCLILHANAAESLLEILKKPWLFSRDFASQDKFHKHFLDTILPSLVQKWIQFGNEELFLEISKIIQKGIFHNQNSNFEVYFSQFFEESNVDTILDKTAITIPKAVVKYLSSSHDESSQELRASFKLIFHSFCNSFKINSSLIYKCLILIVCTSGFDLSFSFKLFKTIKAKSEANFEKSIEIYDVLLDVLIPHNISVECKVQDVPFVDFLKNMLKSFVKFNVRSVKIYEIILKTITINPLVIEPIVGEVISFIMLTNNEKQSEIYEKLLIAIMEVFAKLHRIQNFVSKMVPELKSSLKAKTNRIEVYQFVGKLDPQKSFQENLVVSQILTDGILQYFTKCICDLASWQVINLFKTLLFHLGEAVQEFSDSEDNQDKNKLLFLEILGTLTCTLVQSSKMADHTVTNNTVEKFVKGLEELKVILQSFGTAILAREHNPVSMRTFLSICFNWAEIFITLTYYSLNEEVKMTRVTDNLYIACNLTYLHSYLNVKQWQLISQRITNFGEYPCKRLLQKLYIQKIKALMLFETNFNEDITLNVIKQIQNHMEETWEDFLLDKFVVRHFFPKMDGKSKLFLAENLLKNEKLCDLPHILDSVDFINVLVYATMSKISKLLSKNKKKQQYFSVELFSKIPEEFYLSDDFQSKNFTENIERLYEQENSVIVNVNEDKVDKHLVVLRKLPFIYSNVEVQKMVFLYIFCLHIDVFGVEKLKKHCEGIILGVLQSNKFSVTDVMEIEKVCPKILQCFDRHEQIFPLVVSNTLKDEGNLKQLDCCIDSLLKNAENPVFLKSCVVVFKALNKSSKSKTNTELKQEMKEKILNTISKHLKNHEHCIEAYAVCLKHYLSINDTTENYKKLMKKLPDFLELSLQNQNSAESLVLFLTVLHFKQKIVDFEEDLILKIWKWLKNAENQFSHLDQYSQLVRLIVTLIPNEEFNMMIGDLLNSTVENIELRSTSGLIKQLKIWKSILTCNINPTKMNIWQQATEALLQKLLELMKTSEYEKELFSNIVSSEECIIHTHHFILSSSLIDSLLITPTVLMLYHDKHFEDVYSLSMAILEKLLSHRNASIMDRLPPFLLQYRILLKKLCEKSNSELNLDNLGINKMADLAHKLEKLTKNLVACKKDMGRIALYLVADILERYEQVNLYPNVKLHLNNCVYSLLSLCDHHAVSYLMRALSKASTEMFKLMYEHYKKYYMFTGKV